MAAGIIGAEALEAFAKRKWTKAMDVRELKIKSAANDYPYIKRFPCDMKLKEFKEKLELIVGTSSESMQLELRDKTGKLVSVLSDQEATLEALGVGEGMEINVIDVSGSIDRLKDTSMVEKYVLPDGKYEERAESVRAWRKREQLTSKGNVVEESEKAAQNMKVGDRCVVHLHNQPLKEGTVSYIGTTNFKPGWWVGITYDEAVGKNDGTANGERYFACGDNHGAFVRPQDVQIIQLTPDVEMEEI